MALQFLFVCLEVRLQFSELSLYKMWRSCRYSLLTGSCPVLGFSYWINQEVYFTVKRLLYRLNSNSICAISRRFAVD